MIRCRECGTINDDTAGFCGGCGQFLEWTGERVDDSGQPTAADDQAAPSSGLGIVGVARSSVRRHAAGPSVVGHRPARP